jgi:plastocyanin
MKRRAIWYLCLLLIGFLAHAQEVRFTARVGWAKEASAHSQAGVVIWLASADSTQPEAAASVKPGHLSLVQKNKTFQPHLLAVPVGAVVDFPNRDPFFHNVFSLFEGKRFDLGLYEAGTTREVHFNRPGVSYIFCNIHPEMSAVVIAIPTPYYAISDALGQIVIPNVSAGRYQLHVWYEGAQQNELDAITREIKISPRNSTVGVLQLKQPSAMQPHKNKYGREYDPPTPNTPGYEQP